MLVLGHFFLLGLGHEIDMKWAEVANSFGPTILLRDNIKQLFNLDKILSFKF